MVDPEHKNQDANVRTSGTAMDTHAPRRVGDTPEGAKPSSAANARQAERQNQTHETGRGMDESEHRVVAERMRDMLQGVQFPTSRRELMDRMGDAHLSLGDGRDLTLREALQPLARDRFQDENELIEELRRSDALR